ncbi:MAG: TraX family protein [Acutalibacteraceae bacterium]
MIRMGVFALLSEVPFDLARTGYWLDLGRQNVFITLFLGLCCMTIYRLSEQNTAAYSYGQRYFGSLYPLSADTCGLPMAAFY